MSSSLTFDAVSHRFGAEEVLRDITLCVPESSCVALLGASGSGKSTLLRIAAGLLPPSAGQVRIDGEDVTAVEAEKRETGLVFQRPLLFPHLSVVDNVAFASRMAGGSKAESRRQAREYLELVQLADYAQRMPGQLSGGQEQRVALARALARRPRILLLDEPFSSLDLGLREDMYELLETIREQLRPTIVLVTHDRREASVLADTIAVLEHGEILQHAPVAQIHHQPASPAVNRILGGLNEVLGVIRAGVHHSALGRITVAPDTPDGPALLMPRQESLQLTGAGEAPARGTVTQIRPSGAHTLVRVTLDAAADQERVDVAVEVTGTPRLSRGDTTGVGLRGTAGWVVPL
ncbi:ABC transporter ATP-binding protein [Nesterenkonia aurantiaca]|uniref:ABC-type quaternary amine transporter n=1 Tax=Nesterenkonia aurantiaca TaxID=1436010 RepID=A0A4R7FZL5_9MICC|nr:ABC transporter ATP-binding protein [Nesterenkonia aurantiaca]TDS84280.1 putative spermidine/putrescine transport system ATP-binding protein [Nesterenkonia aurantiaca]